MIRAWVQLPSGRHRTIGRLEGKPARLPRSIRSLLLTPVARLGRSRRRLPAGRRNLTRLRPAGRTLSRPRWRPRSHPMACVARRRRRKLAAHLRRLVARTAGHLPIARSRRKFGQVRTLAAVVAGRSLVALAVAVAHTTAVAVGRNRLAPVPAPVAHIRRHLAAPAARIPAAVAVHSHLTALAPAARTRQVPRRSCTEARLAHSRRLAAAAVRNHLAALVGHNLIALAAAQVLGILPERRRIRRHSAGRRSPVALILPAVAGNQPTAPELCTSLGLLHSCTDWQVADIAVVALVVGIVVVVAGTAAAAALVAVRKTAAVVDIRSKARWPPLGPADRIAAAVVARTIAVIARMIAELVVVVD